MPIWCRNSVAFYQKNNEVAKLETFYADILKCQNYKESEIGEHSDWIGHWLQSNGINPDNLYTYDFFVDCKLKKNHIRIDMEVVWSTMTDVWDLMADKYALSYVYLAEESGCELYVNTDIERKFFTTRYLLHNFDVDELALDSQIKAEYGERLQKLGEKTKYFDSWEKVIKTFKSFQLEFDDIVSLNKQLELFDITVYEYSNE